MGESTALSLICMRKQSSGVEIGPAVEQPNSARCSVTTLATCAPSAPPNIHSEELLSTSHQYSQPDGMVDERV